MKVCVFADIHGNGTAFRAALPMLMDEAADSYIFLGDLCGYYFDQMEILEKMVQLPNLKAILGNHDNIALQIAKGDEALRVEYRQKYGSSIDALIGEENKNVLKWLGELPDHCKWQNEMLACFHGSPLTPLTGYIYPDTPCDGFTIWQDYTCLLGHTHYPMARQTKYNLIVNPGSLGQPRCGGWPTYAVLDTSSLQVHLREVPYDKTGFIQEIQKRNENNSYLINVLQR